MTEELLNTDEILSMEDLSFEDVAVPEWKNRKVRVRGMSGTERDAFEASIIKFSGEGKEQTKTLVLENFRAKILVQSLINGKGERLFSEAQIVDLGKKSASALDRLVEVAKRLSRIGDEDVKEMLGNSEPGRRASSS